MYIPALLSLSLLLLLCAPPWSTEVSAQSSTGNPSVDLVDHYGNVGPYFILLFYRYFNTDPMFLRAYLQQLKDANWLRDYCKYLQVPNRTCVVTRPGTTPHATYIISYLNTECCGVEYVTTPSPPPPTTTTIPTSPTTPPKITTTPIPTTITTTTPITTTTRTTTPTTTTTTPTVTTTTRTTTTTPTSTTTKPTTTTPTTTTTTRTTTTTPTTTTTTPTTTTTTPTTTTTTTATTTPQRSCGPVKVAVSQRIFGGVNAAQGEFPWVAQLLFSGDAQCACVIIDEYNCITAGHCVNYFYSSNLNSGSMVVAAGKWMRALHADGSTEQLRTVVRVKRHELYEDRLLKNDIALVRVNNPFIFNEYVYPVCLPSAFDVVPAFCEVAGFGSLSYLSVQVPIYLQKVSMNAYTREQCLQTFQSTTSYDINTYLHTGVMCAANGLSGGKDACRGDSGSSLMCLNAASTRYTLFGIVSSGFGCGDAGQPGFYTHVPSYRTWLDNAIVELSTAAGK